MFQSLWLPFPAWHFLQALVLNKIQEGNSYDLQEEANPSRIIYFLRESMEVLLGFLALLCGVCGFVVVVLVESEDVATPAHVLT